MQGKSDCAHQLWARKQRTGTKTVVVYGHVDPKVDQGTGDTVAECTGQKYVQVQQQIKREQRLT